MRDKLECAAALAFCCGLLIFTFMLICVQPMPARAQSPTPAPFIEWQVATEYTSATSGQLATGRVSLLKHRATGECWIVYPNHGITPAPRAVCGDR